MHSHTRMHTHVPSCVRAACTYILIYVQFCTSIHSFAYARARAHTHTHTHTHTHKNGTALRPRGMHWEVGGGGVPTSHRDPSGTNNHKYPSETADALPTGPRNRSITKHIAHRTGSNDAQTTPETGVLGRQSRPEHVPNDAETTPKRRPKPAS